MAITAVRRVAVGASAMALATLVAVGGTSIPAVGATGVPALGTAAPGVGGDPPDPALALAVAQWVTNGGEDELKALATDFKSLETAASSDDLPTISLSCSQLENDVENAQAYDPIPDPEAQHDWSDALAQYARGATDCVDGANNSDVDLITQASTEITTGSKDLNLVTDRLNQIAG